MLPVDAGGGGMRLTRGSAPPPPRVPPFAALALALAACQGSDPRSPASGSAARASDPDPRFSARRLLAHVEFLASDELEGRLPGARGGALAAEYLAAQVKSFGLEPGAGGGTYMQPVPLVGIETARESTIRLTAPGGSAELRYLEDFVGADETLAERTRIEAPLVFVGFGIVAPEHGWDDYAGVDVRGKIVLILANEPGYDDPASTHFAGQALTYYGRWTYKFEEAARRGAAGALLVHTDEAAGYGWAVVKSSWGRERPYVRSEGEPALSMAAWITAASARAAFASAGLDWDARRADAGRPGFRAAETPITASVEAGASLRSVPTANVLACLRGSDPALASEAVVFTAHYDHLGVGEAEDGDSIYNGAIDNGSGCAAVLEVARVLASLPDRPRRSILFAFVTAEEGGLRGSDFLARNLPPSIERFVANINIDAISLDGDPAEIVALGRERSTLGEAVARAAVKAGVAIGADRDPRQGYFFRSDHFSFAKVGVSAVSLNTGLVYAGKPDAWGREREAEYRRRRYHRPSDEFDPTWDGVAGAKLASIALEIGLDVANANTPPAYHPGDEFARATSR